VTVAGSLQSEVGCPGDWDPACAPSSLSLEDGVWQGGFSVPAGNWEYKAALNGSWTENYGAGAVPDGPNIALGLAADSTVEFYYHPDTHWVTDNRNSRIVTIAGSFQAALGCASDWDPGCLRSWLQDADGDGTYSMTTTALPAGSYEAKAAINESWEENYGSGGTPGGANIPFAVANDNAPVTLSFTSSTNTLSIQTSAAHDDDIWWADLGHDSRDSLYRAPGRAVETGTAVKLRLRAASGDLTSARVRLWNDRADSQQLVDMSVVADDGVYEWWEATVPASSDPTIYWYRFIVRDGTATAYYEDDASRTGGWGETAASSNDYSWQLTVYDPAFSTPDWVKNAVIYQIFPDRFRDGDPTNNTPPGTFFYDETTTISRSGTGDWNAPICDPRLASGACPNVYSQNFYGGDLAGILDKLDYLDSLGVTAIYLNPIFKAPSNHKYDTTDYSQVDPAFGDIALLTSLVDAMEARGMHLVLDGVFNHTSSDSIYFDRYGRYGTAGACESETSPYRDWYHFSDVAAGTGDCVSSSGVANGATYESWFGYDSLPKLNSANAEVRDLFYAGAVNPIGPYWLTWADGWRLDVGGDVDQGVTNSPSNLFWEGFRDAVRSADPEAYIVGEEWGNATPWTLGAEWDATMNYQLSSAMLSLFRDEALVDNDHNSGSSAGVLAPITPEQFEERVLNLQERYPPEAFAALMNLLGSHDTNRPLFLLDHNADQNDGAVYQDPTYDWSDAIARLKGVVVLQATLPGAPTIYYGDEVGLVGPPTYDGQTWQDDPYNRVPYPWLDETGTPFYGHLRSAEGQANLLDHYELLFNARGASSALRTGDLRFLDAGTEDVLAYGRRSADGSDAAVVVVNRGSSSAVLELDVAGYLPAGLQLKDLFTGDSVSVAPDGTFTVTLAAGSQAVFLNGAALSAVPAAVTDLAAVAGGSAIELEWSAAAGAVSYDVYRSIVSGGGYELVGNVSDTSFVDAGLATGRRYHYVVVSRDDATLLTSDYSKEASATTGHDLADSATTWFNLQWPPTMTHVVSSTARTETVYARIWVDGATNAAGQAEGIRAQVGFGPDGSQPSAGGWAWEEMAYARDDGNNDEYEGSLLPDSTGSFDYAVRWSGDNGATWFLGDLNGPQRDGTLDNPGALTVNAGSDATAPAAPTLSLAGVTASQIDFSWTAPADPDVDGYRVFRDDVRIATVDAGTTSYSDESVTTGTSYSYYVTAFDTSFNSSAASNTVVATAENRLVDVTFRVAVPAFTPDDSTVYVTGNATELGPWNPSAYPMTEVSEDVWERTFQIADGTSLEWKYTRGSWETVESWGSITGLANRGPVVVDYGSAGAMSIDNTAADWGTGADSGKAVQNWADPLVTGFSPADGATDVDPSTAIVVTWSRAMAADANFSVTGPNGPIGGSFAMSDSDTTVTFTPAAPLDHDSAYEVVVTGEVSAAGAGQQAPISFQFTTASAPEVTLEEITVDPAAGPLLKGRKYQFRATALYSDGSQLDVTSDVTWTTSDRSVVTVDDRGLVQARKVGSAVVAAKLDEATGESNVTVVKRR
jgi:glycosidase